MDKVNGCYEDMGRYEYQERLMKMEKEVVGIRKKEGVEKVDFILLRKCYKILQNYTEKRF